MKFLNPSEDGIPDDLCGWVLVLDPNDLKEEDELFPVADLPPKPFPAPEVFVTGQTDDPRPPGVDENGACDYLPAYFWMAALIHSTYLGQRPRIIQPRSDLRPALLLQLESDMMLKGHPFTYEHLGHALDDVRADLSTCRKTAPRRQENREAAQHKRAGTKSKRRTTGTR